MCEFTQFAILMGSAGALVAGAIAAIGVAIALSGGFFSAPAAPGAFSTAAVLTAAAIAALSGALAVLIDYDACLADPLGICNGMYNNLVGSLEAMITVLSIQLAACIAAAVISWIPFVGVGAGAPILAALIVQAALIPSIVAFSVSYDNCVKSLHSDLTVTIASPLLAGLSVVYLALLIGTGNRYYRLKRRSQ